MKASMVALVATASLAYADAGHHGHHIFHLKARTPPPFQSGLVQDSPPANLPVLVPTPDVFILKAPGDAATCSPKTPIILPTSTTAAAATSLDVTAGGTYTFGGVTSSVPAPTTITAVYATGIPALETVSSLLLTTTFTCPTAGVYTIGAYTSTYIQPTVMVYPTVSIYPPGTYTQSLQFLTATSSDQVFFCPYSTPPPPPLPTPSSSSSTSLPSPPTTPSSSTPPPPPPPPPPNNSSSSSAVAPVFANVAASSSSASAAPSAPPAPHSGAGPWCMTYSPYQNGGGCKDESAVATDISKIAAMGFSTIRIYATDCNQLQTVGDAASTHRLKMIVGIYIDNSGIDASRPQIQALTSWGRWNLVSMVVVGNEAVFNGYTTASALAAYISEVKSTIGGAFTGPYTTSETMNTWQASNGVFCSAVDVLGSNIHPYFNAGTSADQAGQFVTSQLQILGGICSGKQTYNLETGWPHAGNANGAAVPGISQQQTALKGIMAAAGGNSAFFSFVDDMWKAPGPLNVEQNFGCSQNWPFNS